MAHVPEDVEAYVCESCQAIYAGTPVGSAEEHEFEAPGTCSACGNNAFVQITEWAHHQREH